MKRFVPQTIATLLSIATLLLAPPASALDQPRMRDAISFLRGAKTAEQPLPLLEKARKELREAARDKKGWRVKAIGEVNEAIDRARANEKEKMIQKIDHAIADIWTGIDKGHR